MTHGLLRDSKVTNMETLQKNQEIIKNIQLFQSWKNSCLHILDKALNKRDVFCLLVLQICPPGARADGFPDFFITWKN